MCFYVHNCLLFVHCAIYLFNYFFVCIYVSANSCLLIWWKRTGGRRSESCTWLCWKVPAVWMQGKSYQHTRTKARNHFHLEGSLECLLERDPILTHGPKHFKSPNFHIALHDSLLNTYAVWPTVAGYNTPPCEFVRFSSISLICLVAVLQKKKKKRRLNPTTQFYIWRPKCKKEVYLSVRECHIYSSVPIIRYHSGPKLDSFPNYSKYLLLSVWCTRWVGCSLLGVIRLMTLFQAGPINHRKMIWSF